MDRCALFVDASYALADGALAVHGTRNRDSVSWDYAGLLKLLGGLSRDRTGLQLLRCYWYDTSADGNRSAEHDVLADIPGVKLRLSKIRPSRKEGVEAEIRKDLTALARNHAISDVDHRERRGRSGSGDRRGAGSRSAGDSPAYRPARRQLGGVAARCGRSATTSSRSPPATCARTSISFLAPSPSCAVAPYRELPVAAASAPQAAIEAPAQRLYGSPVAEYQAALQAQLASLAASGGSQRDQDAARFAPVSSSGGAANGGAANGGTANGRGQRGADNGARDVTFSQAQASGVREQFAQPDAGRESGAELGFAASGYQAGGQVRQDAPGGAVFGHQSLPDDGRGQHQTQAVGSQVSAQAQGGQPGQGAGQGQGFFSGQGAFAGQNGPSAHNNGQPGQNGRSGLGSVAADGAGAGEHYTAGLQQADGASNGHGGSFSANRPLNGAVPGGGMPAGDFAGPGTPSNDRTGNGALASSQGAGGQFGSVPPNGGAPYGSGRPDTGRAEAGFQDGGRPDDGRPDDSRFAGGQSRGGLSGNGAVNSGPGDAGLPSNPMSSGAVGSRGGPAHGVPANGLPDNGVHGSGVQGNGAVGNGSAGGGVVGNGQRGGQDPGGLPGYVPAGQNLPGQNLSAQGQFGYAQGQQAQNGLGQNGLAQNGLGPSQERGQRQSRANAGPQYSADRGDTPYGGQTAARPVRRGCQWHVSALQRSASCDVRGALGR